MPIDVSVWRIDEGLNPVPLKGMDYERDLQEILAADLSIIDPGLMVIGREVVTAYGQRIDILAIDSEGTLVVLELKRDTTPREVVAQLLDYGYWIRDIKSDEIAKTFIEYQERYHGSVTPIAIDEAMRNKFGDVPDELNTSHQLIIVTKELDPATERIVSYLTEEYRVENVRVVSFQVFQDEDHQYLTRVWVNEPDAHSVEPKVGRGQWNSEFYVSFGEGPHRSWNDAKRYGFISAGGGEWYVRTLRTLQPSDRVWVNVPKTGYVGVGKVTASAVRREDFEVWQNGTLTPFRELELEAPRALDEEHEEYFVAINWTKTVDLYTAVSELGFFGNQNTVARPRSPRQDFTVGRLKSLWQVV